MRIENQLLSKALKVGGILVLIMGIAMAGKWFMFREYRPSYATSVKGSEAAMATVKSDVQEVAIDLKPSAYAPIVVQKGVAVRFNIRADKDNINSCNGRVVIPEFNLQVALKPGDNIIEFTPDKAGTFSYKCWMGMVASTINVVDDISKVDLVAIPNDGDGNGPSMSCCQRK